MESLLQNIDIMEVLGVLWTAVAIPVIGYIKTKIDAWAKTKNLEKYTNILYNSVEKVVKDMYESVVKEVKGTDEWTEEKKAEVLELAITKITKGISVEGLNILKEVHVDFSAYIESLIEATLYDLKNAK